MILIELIATTILISMVLLVFVKKDSWQGELIALTQWWAVIYLCLSILGVW